ncbi:hypothetical protein BCR43DRAFT_485797 [Syncephalastrum racemosum]|uniref:Small RNA 2'-O-methyltransferase n=1 Tax=Syncephalastrum racemosum TaxID=13706 RepID=A0A1X2HN10_SYNRA|nr:hypothetical protein BCR43DRAFT_485797 [Syncephalastrum racemosum]
MEDDRTFMFSPPLWRQRRSFIFDTIVKYGVQSVLDYGCGEANVLAYLIPPSADDVPSITRLAGLDIDTEPLQEAMQRCRPWENDYRELRVHPLTVDLYQGSVDQPDARLYGYDLMICSEVIEHLPAHILNRFLDVTLGNYAPPILIVTTPNAEYNIHFDNLNYGKPNAMYRHDDHKFEWTRAEFQAWCNQGADAYGYQTEFSGIGLLEGKPYDHATGHCTQTCVFIRNPQHAGPLRIKALPHKHIQHFDFPFFDEPPLSDREIMHELTSAIQTLCLADPVIQSDNPPTSQFTETYEWCTDHSDYASQLPSPKQILTPPPTRMTRVPQQFPVHLIWDMLRIRQICKSYRRMLEYLATLNFCSLTGTDIIVNKAYPIPVESDDHNQEGSYSISSASSDEDDPA